MGRPLNKKFFGDPEKGGLQMVLSYVWLDDSTEAETGFWIVRQLGTGRYQVTNGDRTGAVRLVDHTPAVAGEGSILVYPFGSDEPEFARKIHNRSVVTWSNNTYKWSVDAADEDGQANFILDTWAEPTEDMIFSITAGTGEFGIGYYDDVGSIEGQPEGFTIIGFLEDGISKLWIQGDHPEIDSIEVTIGDATVVYGYAGSEGNSEFLSEDSFGFDAGETYDITGWVVNLAP